MQNWNRGSRINLWFALTTLILIILTPVNSWAAYGWLEIGSAEYDSHCGDNGLSTIEEALDGTDYWVHEVDEAHWFILDLGATYTILYVKGRSKSTDDPIDVDIYVSDDKENWGSAVATGISTWQDTSAWVEIDSTDKDGRYIKVIINDTEDASNYIAWGLFSVDTIFDVYADVASTPVTVEPAVLPLTLALHAPTISDFASYSAPVLGLTLTLHAPTISATDVTRIYGATIYGATIN